MKLFDGRPIVNLIFGFRIKEVWGFLMDLGASEDISHRCKYMINKFHAFLDWYRNCIPVY